MSLINDALKKTQRMRADPEDNSLTTTAYGMPPRGGRGKSGPSIGLLAVGALALVVLAVGGTLLILRSKSKSPDVAAAKPAEVAPAGVSTAPIVASSSLPVAASPAAATAVAAPMLTIPKLSEAQTSPVLVAVPTHPETATAVSSVPAVTPNNKSSPSKLDIGNFIDAIHVTGVRFSEGSSKVLMNDKVYKVNDVVERTLNIKLIEVKSDSLTFVDETGAVYKKSF